MEVSTFNVLDVQRLSFLVTHRVTTQVVVEASESSLLLGKADGVLIAKVRFLYGIDLSGLTKADCTQEGDTTVVAVPDPEALEFIPDLDSVRYFSSASGLRRVTNTDIDKESLLARLERVAHSFVESEGLIPTRSEMLVPLNAFAEALAGGGGGLIEFRYKKDQVLKNTIAD